MRGMSDGAQEIEMDHLVLHRASRHANGTGSVAAAHIHTAEQRRAYDHTHAKYKRQRGVMLLHHIAKEYGIEITIKPLVGSAVDDDDSLDAESSETAELSTHAITTTADVPNPIRRTFSDIDSNPPPTRNTEHAHEPEPVSSVRRTFEASVTSDSVSPPAVVPTAGGRKVLQLKPRTRPLPSPDGTAGVTDSTIPAVASSTNESNDDRKIIQLSRKRKDPTTDEHVNTQQSLNESYPTTIPTPSPTSSDAAEPPPSKRVKPLTDRKRAGGILGAALQGIIRR